MQLRGRERESRDHDDAFKCMTDLHLSLSSLDPLKTVLEQCIQFTAVFLHTNTLTHAQALWQRERERERDSVVVRRGNRHTMQRYQKPCISLSLSLASLP